MNERFLASKNLAHLKYRRDRKVFIGDNSDARLCTTLERSRIARYSPSQRGGRFSGGFIEFAWGRGWAGSKLFDLDSGTINGKRAYIFEASEYIVLIHRRLKALKELLAYTQTYRGPELSAYAELIISRVAPTPSLWKVDEWLRGEIEKYLPHVGLVDLESLVDAAKPSISEAPGLMARESAA